MRSRTNSTSRSIATVAYADFWRGAGVDRARLAQALPQLPDTADELNAVARDVGATDADIHLGRDASETTLKRAALAQYGIIYFATHGLVAGDVKGLDRSRSLAKARYDKPAARKPAAGIVRRKNHDQREIPCLVARSFVIFLMHLLRAGMRDVWRGP